jgi:hypothetical protein
MKVEKNDETDGHPGIKNEVDASSNSDEFRQLRAVDGHPDKINAGRGHRKRQQGDNRGPPIFGPCVKEHAAKQKRKDNLGYHRESS